MEIAFVAGNVIVLFGLVMVGNSSIAIGILDDTAACQLRRFVLNVALPALIVASMQVPLTAEFVSGVRDLLIGLILFYAVAFSVAWIVRGSSAARPPAGRRGSAGSCRSRAFPWRWLPSGSGRPSPLCCGRPHAVCQKRGSGVAQGHPRPDRGFLRLRIIHHYRALQVLQGCEDAVGAEEGGRRVAGPHHPGPCGGPRGHAARDR